MSIKDTHTAFDELLKEQLSQLKPEVPEGVWEGMDAQLDQINQGLQFDASIRDSVNQINVPAPQGVFEVIQSQLGNAAGISGGLSLAGKWVIGLVITSVVAVSALVLLPQEKSAQVNNTEQTQQNENGLPVANNPSIPVTDLEVMEAEGEANSELIEDRSIPEIADKPTPKIASGAQGPTESNTNPESSNPTSSIANTTGETASPNNRVGIPPVISQSQAPVFAFSQKDTLLCFGLSYESYLLYGDNCTYDVFVNGQAIQSNIKGNEHFRFINPGSGAYVIDWVVRANDEVWKKSQVLVVQSLPELKVNVLDKGNGRYAFVNESLDRTSWYLDGQLKNEAMVQFYDPQPTDHQLVAIATNPAGCKDSTQLSFRNNVIFEVKELVFPNTFTPNGDGKNDFFHVEIEGSTHFQIYIFNSDRQVVFESNDPQAKWDGADKYKGNQVLQGNYTCIVEYALAGGEIKKEMKLIHLLKD